MNSPTGIRLLTLTCLVVTALVGAAQFQRNPSTSPLVATPSGIPLGQISEGMVATRTVSVKNVSSSPVVATNIVSSCGCTTTEDLGTLQPGETKRLTITFNSIHQPGSISKMVEITPQGAHFRPVVIRLSGKVISSFKSDPPALEMGTVADPSSKAVTFSVSRVDGKPLRVASTDGPKGFTFTRSKSSDTEARITCRFPNVIPPGDYSEQLTVSDSDPSTAPFHVPLRFKIPEQFAVLPKEANFGVVNSATSKEIRTTITGPDIQNLTLMSFPQSFSAQLTKVGNNAQLMIRYAGSIAKGHYLSDRVVLKTQNPKQPLITIPIYIAAS